MRWNEASGGQTRAATRAKGSAVVYYSQSKTKSSSTGVRDESNGRDTAVLLLLSMDDGL